MTTDNWFAALVFLAVYATCLLLLDGAHKAYIANLKRVHTEQEREMRGYIRTLKRERLWLEAELARVKDKLAERSFDPYGVVDHPFTVGEQDTVQAGSPEGAVHLQWLPASEEYEEEDG